jgi:hypothetical protein
MTGGMAQVLEGRGDVVASRSRQQQSAGDSPKLPRALDWLPQILVLSSWLRKILRASLYLYLLARLHNVARAASTPRFIRVFFHPFIRSLSLLLIVYLSFLMLR